MSVDIAFQRLRDANPVPEPAALRERRVEAAVFLTGTEQRSRDMETADRPTAIKKKPLGWKWIPALVTAAVVIIAGASLLFSVADGARPPVS